MTIKGKAYIVGAYEHPLRKAPDHSVAQLHAEVAKGAIEDAGLTNDDIDGYFCAGDAPGANVWSMANYMNLNKLRHVDSTDMGGCSYLVHVAHAAEAIAAGKCNVALITLAGRPNSEGSSGTQVRDRGVESARCAVRDALQPGDGESVRDVRDAPHARVRHHQRAARVGQGRRFASRAAQPERDAAGRRHGRGSRELADDLRPAAPARLLRGERRRRRGDRGAARNRENAQAPAGEDHRRRRTTKHQMGGKVDLTYTGAAWTGPRAFEEAGVKPADIKYASIYDSFTITVVLQIEDLGFCKKGEGGKFVADGNLISGTGKLPVQHRRRRALQQPPGEPRRHDEDHRSGAPAARRSASEGAGPELQPRARARHRRRDRPPARRRTLIIMERE